MEVLDAKMIPTQHGLETYLDISNHIKMTDIHIPTIENPFFDIKIGMEYYRLTAEHYYDSQINYFWIRIDPDLNTIALLESDKQSLFGVKNLEEREATKELIGEWIINTQAFKHTIRQLINEKKKEDVTTEEEIRETVRTIELLEKTLELKTEDILKANIESFS
jgi:hypothetical protein